MNYSAGPRIKEIHITPIAIVDPPLLNAAGLHAPYALRTIVEIVTDDNISGITTITANGAYVKVGDVVTLIGLGFACPSGPGIVTFPSGNLGYNFPVTQVIGSGTTFVVNVVLSDIFQK